MFKKYLIKNDNFIILPLLFCFVFFVFSAHDYCYCRGVLNNDNNIGTFEVLTTPINMESPFIQEVLRITNIDRVFITPNFIRILYPIFIGYPEYFHESLFNIEFAHEYMRFEPERTNLEIFNKMQTFISEQLEDFTEEQRTFFENNIIVTPQECRILISDFREICDTHMYIRSPSLSPTNAIVNSPRNF